jgi:3-oxoacyl-[acyl-carrier protein] reductase
MNNFDLKNRVAIITGGAQGFGLAISKRIIQSGGKVVIWDIDEIAIKSALDEISSENLSYKKVDVTNFVEIENALLETEKDHSKIDIFVNNAGITGVNAKVWEYPLDEWKKVIELDLNSTFYCCKAVVPHMIKNNYGRIVNIASIAGKEGNPNASAYSTCKSRCYRFHKIIRKRIS